MISLVPRSFMYFMPLQVGAEVIIGIGVFNKASGFFGILSIFTGKPISAMEWILNLLALALLPLYIMAFLNISNKNALRTLLFSYVYCIDTLTSLAFTIFFSVFWFTTGAKRMSEVGTGAGALETVVSTAVESVVATATDAATAATGVVSSLAADITSASLSSIASAASSIVASATATATGLSDNGDDYMLGDAGDLDNFERRAVDALSSVISAALPTATPAAPMHNKSMPLAQETSETIVITVAVLMIRIYFSLVLIGYARMLVRQQNLRAHNGQPKGSWAAKMQYWAISLAEQFWTGNPVPAHRVAAYEVDNESAARLNNDFDNKEDS